jgi:ribosomal protein L40E
MDNTENKFPINVFEDIKGDSFLKHNKKHVTEDFVTENMKEMGWNVYRPFNDTGIDLIATKNICSKCYNDIFLKVEGDNCQKCGSKFIEVKRFIQVKAREIKGEDNRIFGYTLKSKDFRTDPRHVFLLYSDYSKDFLFINTYEYLKIFKGHSDIGQSHFSTPSFRKGNNKLNSLRRDSENNWTWGGISFNTFLNENGLIAISNPDYDLNLDKYVCEIAKLKSDLFYNFKKGRDKNLSNISSSKEVLINYIINSTVENNLLKN